MKEFFKSVRKHIGKMDAERLREQFGRVADALERSETLFSALKEGLVRLDADGQVVQANPARRRRCSPRSASRSASPRSARSR